MEIVFRKPNQLRYHEEFSFWGALILLVKILITGKFTHPVLIDLNSSIILDGHHRTTAARWLHLRSIPCFAVDYLNDHSVTVTTRRQIRPINKELILSMARQNKVFPYKTTKHQYQPYFNFVCSLSSLYRNCDT